MKASKSIFKNQMHLGKRASGRGLAQKYKSNEPLLRSKPHGKILAGLHKLSVERTAGRLLSQLAENEHILLEVRNLLGDAVSANRRIAPAGEWPLDNFYLIEEQISTAKRHLPKGYSRELPCLLNGPYRNRALWL